MKSRLAALLGSMAIVAASVAWADDPRVYLSWHAPHGFPRATDTLSVVCGSDSAGRDTLYLTFETGRDDTTLYGMSATLYFHAALGDSLGPLWWFGGGAKNPRNIVIEWPTDSSHWEGSRRPWGSEGYGATVYDRTSGSGRLRIEYAVPSDLAKPIRDRTLYSFARILLPRPLKGQANCRQPICIEWASEELAFDLDQQTAIAAKGGNRFVSWNSSRGKVCESYRATRATPWRPKAPTVQPGK